MYRKHKLERIEAIKRSIEERWEVMYKQVTIRKRKRAQVPDCFVCEAQRHRGEFDQCHDCFLDDTQTGGFVCAIEFMRYCEAKDSNPRKARYNITLLIKRMRNEQHKLEEEIKTNGA